MKTMWHIFTGDVRRMASNVVSIIITIGLVVIPGLFTWFNVSACWDPFANTKNLQFAIANEDEGYSSDLLPMKISVGSEIVNSLRANSQLDWTFTTADQAIDGTKSGEYYAAVVIPKDFSRNMMTFFDADAHHATLDYYDNEKSNALAPHLTGEGADEISATINQMFAKELVSSALGIATALINNLDKPEAQQRLATFNQNISALAGTLTDAATALSTYSALTGGAQTLLTSTASLVHSADDAASSASGELTTAKQSVADLSAALGTSASALSGALSSSADAFSAVGSKAKSLFSDADTQAGDSASALRAMATRVNDQAATYEQLRNRLDALSNQLPQQAQQSLKTIVSRFDALVSLQHSLADKLNSAASDIDSNVSVSQGKREQINNLFSQARSMISGINTDFSSSLKPDLDSMLASFSSAGTQLASTAGDIKDSFGDLDSITGTANEQLTRANETITKASESLSRAGKQLTDFQSKFSAALESGDANTIKQLLGSDPSSLASALSAPVALKRHAVFPVSTFGASLAPFYTFIPLWVGALLLGVTLQPELSKKRRAKLGDKLKPHQEFLGHYGIYCLLALCQATFDCGGTLLFLKLPVVHPWLFMLSGWTASFVFSLFVYTMIVSFANVGKAISVLMLIMQISGSDGAYPISILPALISDVHPFLPVSYAVTMMRGAIAGVYGNTYWVAMGKLLCFVPPLLLIGLVLRKPLMKFNTWYLAKVESTQVLT
ncbi:YhgE/Pip domain-containing protein [Bifidobacterium gallicum]|uniref:Phage infection protein n=1 Tax=Bifidobacterium gallicum DSM 20093 = LMG 11596 TaxID=561180 RepID=D1NW09_9BIFI|nr:YhgE/Pip domain-containing protein [Bifidobacterium gallicum]EFA22295.1 YhgE/Pip domain protein [Bifidobacterium gallicum DSM 20093 = LMG 11596]KFI60022.1 phage infection protein [Bifidobacterium gallicum DSM 20093 = LMG 11596]